MATFTPTAGAADVTDYDYDWAGNRTRVTATKASGTTVTDVAFDPAGLPTTSSTGGVLTTYTHDLEGNLWKATTSGQTKEYRYDAWGRLASAIPPVGPSLTYTYDALNRQVGRTKNAVVPVTAKYHPIGITEDVAKLTATGSPINYYAYSAGGPLAQATGSQLRVYTPNLHGDVALIANPADGTYGTQPCDPYGAKRAATGVNGDPPRTGSSPTSPIPTPGWWTCGPDREPNGSELTDPDAGLVAWACLFVAAVRAGWRDGVRGP